MNISFVNLLLLLWMWGRENFWYREIYPYGLNDNVKKVGNISAKNNDNIVVWSVFNNQKRKFRKR